MKQYRVAFIFSMILAACGKDQPSQEASSSTSTGGTSSSSSLVTTVTTSSTSSTGGGDATSTSSTGGESMSSSTTGAGGNGGASSSTSSSSTGGSSSSSNGSGGGMPVAFSCSNWTRDSAFDALKIGNANVMFVGGVWGTSATSVYVPISTNVPGVGQVAHWNGSSWLQEDLDKNTPPTEVGAVWGTSENDVWVLARNFNGYLYHRVNGVWTDDPTKPKAKKFLAIWGANSSFVCLAGTDSTWHTAIWCKNGGPWIAQTLPVAIDTSKTVFTHLWGLDTNHVFATGYIDANADGYADAGVMLAFDGKSWNALNVPASAVKLSEVSGTSINDLFVSAMDTKWVGVVYNLSDQLTTWTSPMVNMNLTGYVPIWSKYPGTFLAGGTQLPALAGALRLTTLDQMAPPSTYAVDNKAYSPVKFWPEPDGKTVHFVHISSPDNQVAGFYTGACN